jgi:hypothetical protein
MIFRKELALPMPMVAFICYSSPLATIYSLVLLSRLFRKKSRIWPVVTLAMLPTLAMTAWLILVLLYWLMRGRGQLET